MRLIDADELIKNRVENDPVVIAVNCANTSFDPKKAIIALKMERQRHRDNIDFLEKEENVDKISTVYHQAYSGAYSYLIDIIEEWERTGVYVNRAEKVIKAIDEFKRKFSVEDED